MLRRRTLVLRRRRRQLPRRTRVVLRWRQRRLTLWLRARFVRRWQRDLDGLGERLSRRTRYGLAAGLVLARRHARDIEIAAVDRAAHAPKVDGSIARTRF